MYIHQDDHVIISGTHLPIHHHTYLVMYFTALLQIRNNPHPPYFYQFKAEDIHFDSQMIISLDEIQSVTNILIQNQLLRYSTKS